MTFYKNSFLKVGILPFIYTILFLAISIVDAPAAEGIKLEKTSFYPGKVDYHYLHTQNTNEHNTIFWSPVLKGGGGVVENDNGIQTQYYGAHFRPLRPEDGKGELIFGFQEVDNESSVDLEFQGEYRFPFGIGIGGGSVSRENGGSDVEFGKVSLRQKIGDWNYILTTQYQELGKEESMGGYIALYDEKLMLVYGNDGEQWRSDVGIIAPENDSIFRPAFEVLFVDNSIGKLDGNRFLFINGTLKYKGGFLRHAARLGRAMGPTGLEFGNPLGFLRPTWNRRLDVWELGGLVDIRLVRTETPTETLTQRIEGLVYPFQFDQKKNALDHVYIGGFDQRDETEASSGVLGGVFGKLGFLNVSFGGDYNFETDEKRVIVGIIDKF